MGEERSVPRRGLEARPGARYDLRDVSARGRSRSPMAKFAGSRRERTSPPPSLARFTGGSSLSSSSKYRAGLFAIRARARRSEPSMVPHLRPPVSDRDSSDLLLPSRDENFRARPGARERPLDPHAITPRTRSRLRPRLHFAPTQIPIRRASRDRGRARRARDAVPSHSPSRKPSESGYDATGRCRANCSVKSEPGRRALEPFREVSRDVRLSESSKTLQSLMCGAWRARVCAAIAAGSGDASCLIVPEVGSLAVAPPAEESLLQNS